MLTSIVRAAPPARAGLDEARRRVDLPEVPIATNSAQRSSAA